MEVRIVAVGKLRSYYREACDEYRKRLRRYATIDEDQVREGRGSSPREIEEDEARRIVERFPKRGLLIALTREGSPWTSVDLAGRLEQWTLESRPLVFAIGGSTGLGEVVLKQARQRWSLGPLTLPHELARVVVYEQVYRAFTILRGEPYHKGKP